MGSGFERVRSVEEALGVLEEQCEPHSRTETVPVSRARGRTVAEPIRAKRAVPHYERAAMDGYAVRAADTVGASDRSPVTLEATEGSVGSGQARQVHTGSALPDGADAVVMVEQVDRRGDTLQVFDAVAVSENVGPIGEDVEEETLLFEPGHRLGPADLGLARGTGWSEVPVFERPRVAVVPTGEEVVEADPDPGEIVETNGLTVEALATQWGADATRHDIVTDDREALSAALEDGSEADIVVTTGGTSVGERDLVPSVVDELGSMLVHGVSIKPGHPVGFGRVHETPVLTLPGYPVSCLVTAVQFLRPAIAWRGGWDAPPFPTTRAELTGKLPSEPGERTFARVTLEEAMTEGDQPETPATEQEATMIPEDSSQTDEPVWSAAPLRVSGASVLSSISFADGWVVIPEDSEGIPAGEIVAVRHWDWEWRP